MQALRVFRRRQLVRIAWRDLAGHAPIDTVLRELSWLAEACIGAACRHATATLATRHGVPEGRDGSELSLLILGMGKLGGGELNYLLRHRPRVPVPGARRNRRDRVRSSTRNSSCASASAWRSCSASVTDDGFVYRVDLRLRPFGDSGPVAVSFDAFEDYLQEHGRDWERYAYVKARPVFGAEPASTTLYRNVLRPFVYRRYLDFGVFESLRSMKDMIAREVERRELQQNVKLGPGGIREIEFIVQAFQLLRGGSTPRLQTRSLLDALPLLAGPEAAAAPRPSPNCSRRIGSCVASRTGCRNGTTSRHTSCPSTSTRARGSRWRWECRTGRRSRRELDLHRDRVSAHFQRTVFAPRAAGARSERRRCALEHLLAPEYRRRAPSRVAGCAAGAGNIARRCLQQLNQLRESAYYRRLDETGRRRLQVLLPRLLRALGAPAECRDRAGAACCTCSSASAAARSISRC